MNKQMHRMNLLSSQCLLSIMGIGIVTLSLLATGCTEQTAETRSPEAIAKRIEPAGKVKITSAPEETSETTDTAASSEEKSPATPAPAKKEENAPATNNNKTLPTTKGKESQLIHGKTIVKNSCAACHTGNLPVAPVIGNAEDWAPRLTQGEEILTQHATQGYLEFAAKSRLLVPDKLTRLAAIRVSTEPFSSHRPPSVGVRLHAHDFPASQP